MPKPTSPKPDPAAATPSVTRETLDGVPARVIKFLGAVGKVSRIRTALQTRGFTGTEHAHGWSLMHAACGYVPGALEPAIDPTVNDAIHQLDKWDEGGFRIVRASLAKRHPDQAAFVLAGGLAASTGMNAVLGVETLLDRLDALDKAPERKSTRKADHAALATLAARGIDDAERARLRALVGVAEALPTAADAGDDPVAADAAHVAALVALKDWYDEWAEIADVVVKRHDDLIRLGLAKRKAKKKPPMTPPAGK